MIQFVPAAFFAWCHDSAISGWINDSTWAFAIIETFHILALTVLLGTIVALDLRLLDLRSSRQSTAELAEELMPYTIMALVVLIVTGIPMFMSQAIRYSQSVSFFVKMTLLVLTIVFHFTIYRTVTMAGIGTRGRSGRLAASLSLMCWFGVALAGRGIAFLP